MQAVMTSPLGFIFLLLCFAIGAAGSLLLSQKDRWANAWQNFFAILGSVWGLIFSIGVMIGRGETAFGFVLQSFPSLSVSFRIDALSAFFIFVISLLVLFCSIYGIGYIKQFYRKYSIGALGFFFHAFILSMLMVVSAANGFFFLVAWELMAIASYLLVVYEHRNQDNIDAGFLYLVMTHVGTAFIILAFLLLHQFTGSFDFEEIRSSVALLPGSVKNIVFLLALVGFGTKAGMIPFHIWLPRAHPAAPSHVSALMSGVMIKTGIYMMIRIFLELLTPIPLWWGALVLVLGLVSALLGVLYALTEHDLKRLLAYHSIENIGIILLGLGSAMIFYSLGNVPLALFGLGAALFHTLNHAIFKSLLFLSAGSVIHQTHTRNMEELGGLIKVMPKTAFLFLVGSMAISALPPFNGFFSEWLTFQTLMQGMATSDVFVQSLFILSAGGLAITGGLALACFVKAFGITFLARPRSPEVEHAKESSPSLLIGMGALALASLLFGIFSGTVGSLLLNIGESLKGFQTSSSLIATSSVGQLTGPNGLSTISGPAFLAFFLLTLVAVVAWARWGINKNQKIRTGATWDCGTDLTSRMEITATGFARSIVVIFAGFLRPSVQHEIEYHDSQMRYFPKSRTVSLGIRDVYQIYFYRPLNKFILALSLRASVIQNGNINLYVLYLLCAVLVALFFITFSV